MAHKVDTTPTPGDEKQVGIAIAIIGIAVSLFMIASVTGLSLLHSGWYAR